VRPVCALRVRPLSCLPAETPFGGLPPPFPTTLPPHGDPERVVGNGSGKWWCRQAGQRLWALRARGDGYCVLPGSVDVRRGAGLEAVGEAAPDRRVDVIVIEPGRGHPGDLGSLLRGG